MRRADDFDRQLDLAALHATEGLAPEEARELFRTADGARAATEFGEAAAALHLASAAAQSASVALPAGLEARLLARAQRELGLGPVAPAAMPGTAGTAPAAPAVQAPQPSAARPSPWVWIPGWAAAAAAAALAVVLAGRLAQREEQLGVGEPGARRDRLVAEAPDTAVLDWTPLTDPSAKGLAGRVVWSDSRNEGYMTFRGLAANDPSAQQYQLWIFRGTDLGAEPHPVDGGVFDVRAGEEVVVPIDAKLAVGRAATFVVTLEPAGGVVVSDRSRLVALAQRAI